ncbi:MAG: PPC domain-containing DNA-binding protein [Desulfatibacillaceae bacterium]
MSQSIVKSRQFWPGRCFAGRIPLGSDLFDALSSFCLEKDIACALFRLAGNLSLASCGCLDQFQQVYVSRRAEGWLELGSGTAFVSVADKRADVVVHASFTDAEGATLSGRLFPPTTVHAVEFMAREYTGEMLRRAYDANTGLELWDL